MLAAIESNHLSSQRRSCENKSYCRRYLFRRSASAEDRRSALALEIVIGLMDASQNRTRTDGIDAYAWCQRLGESSRRRPKPRLGDRVGEEIRGQVPNPLIDDVDDVALATRWQTYGHCLSEEHGCLEIDAEMQIPRSIIEALDGVGQKFRSVIDEHRRRAEFANDIRNEFARRIRIREVGAK